MTDAPRCPCGHELEAASRTVGLQPEGGEPVVIPDVEVWACGNCDHVRPTEAGRRLLFAALGADPDRPLPIKVRIYLTRTPAQA